ncbi:hypothetical protein [Streptomyces pseudovenezuelae]|uniref:Uncharacterized protein n=1 Tax=Streptomyces pseudovenezuelae TaxID=67350 RepID=A0ABT6M0H7_9ACTN|nr:hypothetical protein [Streptomyces pseudovenezuelae]MDH6222061.1 hypothetical protein [Streptomyces pseudovenezuelae]
MSTIDDLLAQSLLLHRPVPSDVVPYDDLAYAHLTEDVLLWDVGHEVADDGAAQSLAVLCEAVVTHCTPDQLADFLTDQVPQPRAAWILGCALQLAGADDGARFWWQYAAGADDAPASYCLYLQHLAQGDTHAAALWQAQAGLHAPGDDDGNQPEKESEDAPALRMMNADTSLPTVLRILSRLTRTTLRRPTPMARAVIEFVSTAVALGYECHPDLELPVPGEDFAERLEILAYAASGRGKHIRATDTAAQELPNRPVLGTISAWVPERARARGPEELVVEVTAAGHEEPASVYLFFREAVAVCWGAATAASSADGHETRMAYHLKGTRRRPPSGFRTVAPSSDASPSFRGL